MQKDCFIFNSRIVTENSGGDCAFNFSHSLVHFKLFHALRYRKNEQKSFSAGNLGLEPGTLTLRVLRPVHSTTSNIARARVKKRCINRCQQMWRDATPRSVMDCSAYFFNAFGCSFRTKIGRIKCYLLSNWKIRLNRNKRRISLGIYRVYRLFENLPKKIS